jgi:hypothetical protein
LSTGSGTFLIDADRSAFKICYEQLGAVYRLHNDWFPSYCRMFPEHAAGLLSSSILQTNHLDSSGPVKHFSSPFLQRRVSAAATASGITRFSPARWSSESVV